MQTLHVSSTGGLNFDIMYHFCMDALKFVVYMYAQCDAGLMNVYLTKDAKDVGYEVAGL